MGYPLVARNPNFCVLSMNSTAVQHYNVTVVSSPDHYCRSRLFLLDAGFVAYKNRVPILPCWAVCRSRSRGAVAKAFIIIISCKCAAVPFRFDDGAPSSSQQGQPTGHGHQSRPGVGGAHREVFPGRRRGLGSLAGFVPLPPVSGSGRRRWRV
jgi:hypothetical protein